VREWDVYLAMAVAAAAASHLGSGAIPDQDSHSPAGPPGMVVVTHQGNYADLAGRLGIRSDRSDYTAADHCTDSGTMGYCWYNGSMGGWRVVRSSAPAEETRGGQVGAPTGRMSAVVGHVYLRNTWIISRVTQGDYYENMLTHHAR
jgi:hypothetical protein